MLSVAVLVAHPRETESALKCANVVTVPSEDAACCGITKNRCRARRVTIGTMSKVEQLEQQIEALSPAEFAELRDWLLERDWNEWDQQIERDASAGKLDRLFEDARAAHRQGKSTKF